MEKHHENGLENMRKAMATASVLAQHTQAKEQANKLGKNGDIIHQKGKGNKNPETPLTKEKVTEFLEALGVRTNFSDSKGGPCAGCQKDCEKGEN